MDPEKKDGQGTDAPATRHRQPDDDTAVVVERWWDVVEWWSDPRLAYARGVYDGYRLGRDDQADVDDAVHRYAVRRLCRMTAQANRRAAADRGELVA
jgi:hypothetical protein